jgi:hypothetical protein
VEVEDAEATPGRKPEPQTRHGDHGRFQLAVLLMPLPLISASRAGEKRRSREMRSRKRLSRRRRGAGGER